MAREIDKNIPHVMAEVDEVVMLRNHARFEQHLRVCQPCRLEYVFTAGVFLPRVQRQYIIHFVETER